MQAKIGDHLVVKNHRVGVPDHECEVLEVRGPDGGPPYLVRWQDSQQEALFFPGPDAVVHR